MAPLALMANGVSIARYQQNLRMTAHDEHCSHAVPLGICGCYPGQAPAPVIILPLPEMLLTHRVSAPAVTVRTPDRLAPRLIFPSGFVPAAYHPPRG